MNLLFALGLFFLVASEAKGALRIAPFSYGEESEESRQPRTYAIFIQNHNLGYRLIRPLGGKQCYLLAIVEPKVQPNDYQDDFDREVIRFRPASNKRQLQNMDLLDKESQTLCSDVPVYIGSIGSDIVYRKDEDSVSALSGEVRSTFICTCCFWSCRG